MEEKVYTLQKRKDRDEYHLFECTITTNGTFCETHSICNSMAYDKNQVVLSFLREDQARLKSAKGGRQVCGICVSHLYNKYDCSELDIAAE